MIYKNLRVYCAIIFLIPIFSIAQEQSINNGIGSDFKTTKSVGVPPKIFTTSFKDKVAERIKTTTEIEDIDKEDYAKYTNYALNNLLHSGLVLYGDPMTNYIQKIAAKLLTNDAQLKNELQFYVIKTNITNALCTDPGVIFITTGLISQVENEAQLAYIIAHEIVHHQEKHLQKSFTKAKENNLDPSSSYEDLVLQSKDHEFEADANALKLYHAAGYSDKEINTVFDVLMYSYLTFDEIEIDNSFFGNSNIYIPTSYFPEKANPILAFEDYDDSKSSHPNIRKRKDAISGEIKKYSNWKSNKNFIDLNEFENIQNIARFESVRGNIINADYIKALYEIYILEKQFTNNEYLQTSKALTYSIMNQVMISGKKRTFLKDADKKEGAISMLYGFFSELKPQDLALLAIRQTEDAHQQFPESKRIKEIRDETIANLAHLRNFEINRLESISFLDAIALRDEHIADTIVQDSTAIEGETKYDRIRRIRAQQSSTKSTTELVDENFSYFLLYDLVSNREFNEIFEKEKENKKLGSNTKFKSKKERKKEEKEKMNGDIILLTPHLEAKNKGSFDIDRTLLFYDIMSEEIEKYAPKGRVHNKDIALAEGFTTEKYNEASLISSFLIQTANLENGSFKNQLFDYEEMREFFKNYENPYLVLISGKSNRASGVNYNLSGNAKYIEIATGNISSSSYYSVPLKIRSASVGGLVYNVFSKF